MAAHDNPIHSAYRNITTPEEFSREVDACLEYVTSPRFPIPPFSRYFSDELRAMRAFTADGRAPLVAERQVFRLGWVISREFDEGGVPIEGEWREMRSRLHGVSNFFAAWPTQEQVLRGDKFAPGIHLREPKHPTHGEVAAALDRIVDEMQRVGLWSDAPIEPAKLSFKEAFASDTMTGPEWLQFIFIPSVRQKISQGLNLPGKSNVSFIAKDLAADERHWPLMWRIGEFDDLF